MAAYKYKAAKNTGRTIESIIYAKTVEEAREKIAEMGYVLEKIEILESPDRRIYERLNKKIECSFRLFHAGQSEPGPDLNGTTRNISAGGLLFSTAANLRQGVTLDVGIKLGEHDGFRCLARVIRCEKSIGADTYDVAVCFLDLPNTERQRLNSYISEEE